MDEKAIKDDKSDSNTAKNLSKSDSRFTRSRTYSLDLFSTNHGALTPRPSKYPYSGKRPVKNYPSLLRASSVPVGPASHPRPFSRSSSAKKSSSTQKIEDKNSARRLIQNLVTIFSHSRSPGNSTMNVKKEPVSSGDDSRESSITAQPAALDNETLEQSPKKEPIEKINFSSDSTETDNVPTLGEEDVHTFHTPISSPSPASDTGLDNSLAVDDLANCTSLNEPTINEVENDDRNEPVNSCEPPSLHQEYSTEDCGLVRTSDDSDAPVNSSEQPSLHQEYSPEDCGLVRTSDDSNEPVNSSEQPSLHQEYSPEGCGLVRTSDDSNEPANSSEQPSLHQEYSPEDCGLIRTSDDSNEPVNSSEQPSLHQEYSPEDCGLVRTSDDSNEPVNRSEQPSLHQEYSPEDCGLVRTSDDSNEPVNSSEQPSLHQEYSTEDCGLARTSDDSNEPVNSSEQPSLHQEYSPEGCGLVRTSDDSNEPVNSSEQPSLHQEYSPEGCGLVRTSDDSNEPVNRSEQPSLHQEYSTEDCGLVRTSNTVIPVPLRVDGPILSDSQVTERNIPMNQITSQGDELSDPVTLFKSATTFESDKPTEAPPSGSPTPMELNEDVTSEDPNTTTTAQGVASQQYPPTLEGEDDMSETTLSAMSGEEYDQPHAIKDEKKSSRTGTRRTSKARRLIAKARVTRRQDNELKAKRTSHSKKKVKRKKSKQLSPPPPKRSRYDNSSPVRSQSKPQPKPTPPKGNVLASILTDIPEVDICPLSAHKTTPITSVAKHISATHSRKVQLETANTQQQAKTSKSKSNCQLPTVHTHSPWNKFKDGTESDHHKLLMRWQKDIVLGTNALTAPMLYAIEQIPEVLNTKIPWIEKAKVVWSVWRRKVKPEEKKVYLKKARDNRAKARNVSKQNTTNDSSSTAPEGNESEEEEDLPPSSSTVKTLAKDDVRTTMHEIDGLEITPNAPNIKPPQSTFKLNRQPLPNFQAKPMSVLATPTSIRTQSFSNAPVSTTPTIATARPTPLPVYIPLQVPGCNPLRLSPSTSQWQGIVPLQIPSAIVSQIPGALKKEKVDNREPTKRLSSIGHTSFSLNSILSTKLPCVAKSPSALDSPQFSELNISTHTMQLPSSTVTPVSNYTGHQFINTSGHAIPSCLPLLSRNKLTPSYSITTYKPSSTGGTKDKTKKATKIRKKEGLSSRLSSQMPLASPTFVIPQLDQSSHKRQCQAQCTVQANTYGQISIGPGHNARSGKYGTQQTTPTSHAHSYVLPSMLLSGPRLSSPLEVTVSVPSGGSRSRSVSVSSSGRSASLPGSPQLLPSSYTPDHSRYMKQGGRKQIVQPLRNEVPMSFSTSSAFPMPSPTLSTPFSSHSTPLTSHSAQTTPSTTHTTTPTSPISPSSYYNSNQYKLSILKKLNEFHQMQSDGSDSHYSSTQGANASVKIEGPSMHFTQQNSTLSHPMVVQPAMRFNEEVDTPSPSEPTPLTGNSLATCGPSLSPSSPRPVKPSLMVNAAYVGDFSSMSLWEMEQLYAFNKAALFRQKKITKVIRAQLITMQQEARVSQNKKLSRSDLYKRFLHFLVQPKFTPTCDLVKRFPAPSRKMDVLDTNFDRPILKKEFDKYGCSSTAAEA